MKRDLMFQGGVVLHSCCVTVRASRPYITVTAMVKEGGYVVTSVLVMLHASLILMNP